TAELNLALARLRAGRWSESRASAERAIAIFAAQVDLRAEGYARQYLARALLGVGETADAEEQARRAVALHEHMRPALPSSLASLGRVQLARGAPGSIDEAVATSARAIEIMRARGPEEGEAFVLLTHAEALWAAGQKDAARSELAAAAARLSARAERILDPML